VFTFIELEPFARARERLFDDDDFRRLQRFLIAESQAGDRVIYFLRLREDEIVLVTAYAKNERDNIDAKLLKRLRKAYEEGHRIS
jgi:hypothetical protein